MAKNPNPAKLVEIPTVAPMPFMVKGRVSDAFIALKRACIEQAGFDFLAKCADVMRSKGFTSNKPGVALKSNHMTGRAFDYDQVGSKFVVVSEPKGGRQYFRTWLKCSKQDGSQGTQVRIRDIRGFTFNGWCFDFTAYAENLGWSRIPAHAGWSLRGKNYSKMEFWHYELMEGKTWQQAMDDIYKSVPELPVLGKGSKGEEVKDYQSKLHTLGYIVSKKDVDGVFGPRTEAAVIAFQKANGLSASGKINSLTRSKINQLMEEKKMSFEYDTDEVNAAVTLEAEENAQPKPWYATSQFAVLLATYILGPVAMFLAAKGVITPDQAPALVGIFQTAVVGAIAWVTQRYIQGRNEVSAIKARAAAVRSLGVTSPEALSAFRALDRS